MVQVLTCLLKRRRVACQHFPDDQTLRLQTGAGEDIIHLPSGLDRVDCERQAEEEHVCFPIKRLTAKLESGFEPWFRLVSSDFSVWLYLELVFGGFLRVLRFSPLCCSLVSTNEIN